MTPIQEHAIHNIVRTEEELQKAWNEPRKFKFPGFKNLLVCMVTIVVKDSGNYKWMAAARVYNITKQRSKESANLTIMQQATIRLMITNELDGVGHLAERTYFNSKWAMHLETKVTGTELGEALRPNITKSNGHKPKITTNEGALRLLDRIEQDFNKNRDNRIILPNQD